MVTDDIKKDRMKFHENVDLYLDCGGSHYVDILIKELLWLKEEFKYDEMRASIEDLKRTLGVAEDKNLSNLRHDNIKERMRKIRKSGNVFFF